MDLAQFDLLFTQNAPFSASITQKCRSDPFDKKTFLLNKLSYSAHSYVIA